MHFLKQENEPCPYASWVYLRPSHKLHQAWSVKVGLQGAPATDIAGPAVEASSQGIGITNVNLNGTDTCIEKEICDQLDGLTWRFSYRK